MTALEKLFENNRKWSSEMSKAHEGFFEKLSCQQKPEYLWIGCSDSRVPANELIGLLPGEVFVHRNVANLVIHTDFNCLSVIQYAASVLKVKHIIVCGHYGCGGVQEALENQSHGFINNWLRHLRDIYHTHAEYLDSLGDSDEKVDRLCELNVISQVKNICRTTIVKNAWKRGQDLTVHGWIYNIANGLLNDLDISVSAPGHVEQITGDAFARVCKEDSRADTEG